MAYARKQPSENETIRIGARAVALCDRYAGDPMTVEASTALAYRLRTVVQAALVLLGMATSVLVCVYLTNAAVTTVDHLFNPFLLCDHSADFYRASSTGIDSGRRVSSFATNCPLIVILNDVYIARTKNEFRG
jgi:hypothetical protein